MRTSQRADPAGNLFLLVTSDGDRRRRDDDVADDHAAATARIGQRVQVVASPRSARGRPSIRSTRPFVAEVRARMAGLRVDGDQVAVAGAPEDALVLAVGPVGDAALVPAQRSSSSCRLRSSSGCRSTRARRSRVDRCAHRRRRVEVEHAADHQRRRLEVADERRLRRRASASDRGVCSSSKISLRRRRPIRRRRQRHAERRVGRLGTARRLAAWRSCRRDLVERRVLGCSPRSPP